VITEYGMYVNDMIILIKQFHRYSIYLFCILIYSIKQIFVFAYACEMEAEFAIANKIK
jgi:hypothetical protein